MTNDAEHSLRTRRRLDSGAQVDPGGSSEASARAARIPQIAECYAANGRIQLPGTVVTANGKLSGRFRVTLSAGDVIRVEAVSSRGPRALLAVEEPPLAADGGELPSASTAQHSPVVTFKVLEQVFELLAVCLTGVRTAKGWLLNERAARVL
jgi:hypothetical protein